MTQRQSFLVLFGLLAAAAAVVFLAISIDSDLYAPGAGALSAQISHHGHLRTLQNGLPPVARRALSPVKFLRKTYSIVAFAIVGLFAAPLIPRKSRILGDAILVAAFSTVIEFVQKLTGSEESFASNLFDVACGAVGGIAGALVWNAVRPGRPRAGVERSGPGPGRSG